MTSRAARLSLLLAALMVLCTTFAAIDFQQLSDQESTQNSGKASGIDVHPTRFDISYSNSADRTKYALLSSQDPSGSGFNRPANLFVIDGMLNVSSSIQITVANTGSTASGTFQMRLVVLHNEYSNFELLNTTMSVTSVNPSSTTTVSHTWTPHYGGNHTIVATTLHSTDDDTGNDAYSRSLAIGQFYDTCDATAGWTFGQNWQLDSEVSLSNNAFHIGSGGTTSSHGNNWDRSVTSPSLNYANAHPNPQTYPKIGFFYTGSGGSGDGVRIEWRQGGTWVNTVNNGFSFDGVVDGDLTDGTNWLITSEARSPSSSTLSTGWNVPTSVLNSQTQFRLRFISDATDNAQGYWIEDIVLIYDEKAWPSEFTTSMNKNSADSYARRGNWAEHTVTIQNTGNVTDSYQPTVTGLPSDWDVQFVHMSGSTILPSMTLDLDPGQSLQFRIQVKPGPSATVGPQSATASIVSTMNPTTTDSVTINTIVEPDFIPEWDDVPRSFYCLPGEACEFSVNLTNAGDGSDTFGLTSSQVVTWNNWTFDISFNQAPTVTLQPQGMAQVLLQADIPPEALPGQTASIDLTAVSQTDSLVSDTIRINLTASMVSDASVGVAPEDVPEGGWWVEPGESIQIPFTVWNNATSQDSFEFSLDESQMRGWNATLPMITNLVVRPGETSKITITLTAPNTAQSGDPAPVLTPIVTSTISGSEADSTSYSGIRVLMLNDIILRSFDAPLSLIPGQVTSYSFEVENAGNGPEHATVNIEGLPSTWSSWVEVDGMNLSGPISLSPTYDGEHIVQFEVIILAPGGEDANINVEFTVTVTPSGLDLQPDDNSIMHSVITERITRPVLNFGETSLQVRTDSTHILGLTIFNDGNSYDHSMRVRIIANSLIPGVTSTLSNTGQSVQLNDWMDIPLLAQQELEMAWIIGISNDVPVNTEVIFSIILEGGEDSDGVIQSITHNLTLTVSHHRSLSFDHSLQIAQQFEVGTRALFTINVTSHSSTTEELTLHVDGGEEWQVVCNNQESSDEQWLLIVPTSTSEDGRKLQWDCELTTPELSDRTELRFKIADEEDETLWQSSPAITVIAPPPVEQGGYLMGLAQTQEQMVMMGIAAGILFLIFVLSMVVAINRRRARIEIDEDEEEDEEEVVQYSPAGTWQTQTQQETSQVPTQEFSDEQFRAAGWSDERIAEYRREQANEAEEQVVAQQHAVAQGAYNQAVQSPQQAVQPVVTQQQAIQQPESQSNTGSSLSSAFGSLGVPEQTESEPTLDAASAASILGPAEPVAEETNEESNSPEQATEDSNSVDDATTEINPTEPEAPSLPQVNCSFCDGLLTESDKWSECPQCNAYRHELCVDGQQVCARCGHRL